MNQSPVEQSNAIPPTSPTVPPVSMVPAKPFDASEVLPETLEALTTGKARTFRIRGKLIINAKWFWENIGRDQTAHRP